MLVIRYFIYIFFFHSLNRRLYQEDDNCLTEWDAGGYGNPVNLNSAYPGSNPRFRRYLPAWFPPRRTLPQCRPPGPPRTPERTTGGSMGRPDPLLRGVSGQCSPTARETRFPPYIHEQPFNLSQSYTNTAWNLPDTTSTNTLRGRW